MFLTSHTLTPFFAIAIYLDLIIGWLATLAVGYFKIKANKKERTKLLMGFISIIIGGAIIIISLLGILSFYIYAGGISGGGIA